MNLKNRKPYFIENSKIPVILSKVAPIEIWAISFGLWVWCRGEISDETKRHETIHFQQPQISQNISKHMFSLRLVLETKMKS